MADERAGSNNPAPEPHASNAPAAGAPTDAATQAVQTTSAWRKLRPGWLRRPSWKESTWRLARRIVLPVTAILVAALIGYTGIVSPDTPLHRKLFFKLLGTLIVIMLILMVTGQMGAKPDENSAAPTLPEGAIPPAETPSTTSKVWQDLLTLEYQKGAERYENLYKAIWLNFSYAVAVGAAIITFGATKLDFTLLQFVALCPIVFWFVATFIPMNHYGELTRERLRDIENDLNAVFFRDSSGAPIKYSSGRLFGFQHFARFGSARALWRVGDVVHITGALIGLYWLWMLAAVMAAGAGTTHQQISAQSGGIQVPPVGVRPGQAAGLSNPPEVRPDTKKPDSRATKTKADSQTITK